MYIEDDHSSSKRIILIILVVILLAIIIFLLLRRCGNNEIKISQINLTPTRLNLKVGEQQKIYANIFPTNASNSNVTWSIGDTNIATVDDNGLVTGVSDGTTLVVATANDGSGIVGSATVTVGNELPELEQIQLNRSTYIIGVGKSVMVELTPVPSTASLSDVQYSILDTSIATVDSTGRIRGVQVGNTTITIKANDGKVTTTANVRVVASSSSNVSDDSTGAGDSNESNDPDTIIPVSTINLTATETCYRLKVGSTYIIGVEVLPSNATDKTLTWEVVSVDDANDASKNKVAEAYISVSDTGVVKGLKEGNARIKITAKSGFYAYFNINVISSGNEGYCSLNSGGNSGVNTGGTGDNTGSNTGNNTGSNTGGNTGTGGSTGDNTGSNTGNNTGSNTGGSTGTGESTSDNTGSNTGNNTGNNTGGNTGGSTGTAGGKCTVSSSIVNIKNGSSTTITINCSSTSKGGKNSNIKYDTCSNVATVTPSGTKNVTSTSFSETVTITGKAKGTCTIILPEGYGVFGNQKTTSQTIAVNVSDDNTTGGNAGGNTGTAGGTCTVSLSTVNIKNGGTTTVTVKCSSTSSGSKNSNISNTCSNIATVSSSGAKDVTNTSFSEIITITGKSKGTCKINLPEGYGLFGGKKTTAQTIIVNVSDDSTTGGNIDSTIKKPTVSFLCGSKTYSSSCSTNVTASITGGTKGTDYDDIYVCLISGPKSCNPTSTSIKPISASGEYTYCAAYVKNGKKGEATCANEIVKIDKSTTTTVKKPTVSFLCGSKAYSNSCSTNVIASITGGTKGIDYDDIYVCLISGPKSCNPTSTSIKPISASGEYTYCAAYVKNGKKGEATCANEIVKIDKSTTTTVKKPTISFLCGSKTYSNSCSTNVTASITGGVEGTDYDSKYVCLQSGDGHCDPTSTTMPKISSSGKYTYCAAYVKNGKKSEVACDTKDIKIIAPVEETATITIDTSSKNIRVFAPIGSIVTFSCLNANCGNSYNMISGQFTRQFTIEDTTILTTIIVTVTHNGKQLDKEKATIDGKPINTPTITAISNNKTYVSDTWTNSTIDIVLSGAADDEEYYHYNLPLASGNKETFSEQMNMPISYKICKKNNPTKCGHRAKIRLKIDKTAPTCQLSFDATNKTITATLQDNLSGIGNIFTGDYKESSSNKYVKSNITKSGSYTFVFFDAASNPGRCSIEIGERTEYMREKCDEYTSYELTGSRNNNTCWASGKAGSTYEYSTCTDWPIYHIKLPVNGKCSLYYEGGFSETKSFTIHFLESDTYTSFNSILNECRNRLKKVCDDYKSKDSDILVSTLVSSGECNKYIITEEGNKLQRSYKATKCNKFVLESDWQTAFLRCDDPIVCHVETRTILYSK